MCRQLISLISKSSAEFLKYAYDSVLFFYPHYMKKKKDR